MILLAGLLSLIANDGYFLGKDPIERIDLVEMGGKLYVRAERLQKGFDIVWRISADGKHVGVVRDGVGGRSMKIGAGQEALVHSKDLYLSLEAIEQVLNAKVVRESKRITIDPKAKAGPDPEPKRTAPVPGDRMIDFVLPPLRGSETVPLSKQKKKRILFILWSSWDASRSRLAEWQKLQTKHKGAELVVVACAVGCEGEERPRSFIPAEVAYPVVHDAHWRMVSTFQLKTFPQWVLVDELGFIRALSDMKNPSPPGDDFEMAFSKLGEAEDARFKAWIPDETRRVPELVAALAKKESSDLRLALSRAVLKDDPNRAEAEARKVLQPNPESWEAAVHAAAALWRGGKNAGGVDTLKEYLKRIHLHTMVRRQKWAVEFPEKIYGGELDEPWLKAQEEKELGGG